jgi:predicted TIM-barrel fold metal-dependent hydrolase
MEENNVEKAVIFGADIETTFGSKVPNEVIANIVDKYPEKFIGFAGVDPHKGMDAVRELDRAFRELHLVGLNLAPWLHKLTANDKKFYPLYAKCVEYNIPVILHTSINFSPYTKMDFGNPMYLDEVAMDFPELKIVASHGGWPWVQVLIALAWRHDNIYIELSGVRPKYWTVQGSGWEPLLRYGTTLLKERIFCGTDWPLISYETYMQDLEDSPIQKEIKELWAYKNAEKFFGTS